MDCYASFKNNLVHAKIYYSQQGYNITKWYALRMVMTEKVDGKF